MSDLVRLSVNMNLETAAALKNIMNAKEVSATEAVRRCIALATFVYGEQAENRRIITDDGFGGNVKELLAL